MITSFEIYENNGTGRFLTGAAAKAWCREVGITTKVTVGQDGTVDVFDDAVLGTDVEPLTHIRVRFGTVYGNFNCSYNALESLEGSPRKVYGGFYCGHNHLETLEGGPDYVDGLFTCNHNSLKHFYGLPKYADRYQYDGSWDFEEITLAMEQVPEELRMSLPRDTVYAMAIKNDPGVERYFFPDGMPKDISTDDAENLSNFL